MHANSTANAVSDCVTGSTNANSWMRSERELRWSNSACIASWMGSGECCGTCTAVAYFNYDSGFSPELGLH